ncbi:MAG: low molecular weight phosphotyrosine protein phosphatase [Phycisphaeraceae bacterium]|nr:MAG: low molecular weight phosphotyrosine protein phosphatase [Phycisphaeraceae bacterium]
MSGPESGPIGVLFLCMGNICRSPLAEGIFVHLARERGVADRFLVDSCGTGGWHVGHRPDPRSIAVAERHGVDLPSRARQLDAAGDRAAFDLIVAMDRENRADALAAGVPREKVVLMRDFAPGTPKDSDVPDPYYGGPDGFDRVYAMLVAACGGLLDHLLDGAQRSGAGRENPRD